MSYAFMKHVQVDHLEWNQIRFRLDEFDYPYSMFVNCFTYTHRTSKFDFYPPSPSPVRDDIDAEFLKCEG